MRRGRLAKFHLGRVHPERCIGRGAAELVEFKQRGLQFQLGLRRAPLQREFAGFYDARFKLGCNASRLPGEVGFLQRGEAVRDFADGASLRIRGVQSVGERPRAGLERMAKSRESEFGELDIGVGDGFPEGEAARPFESLRHGHGPRRAFTGEHAGHVLHALTAELDRQLGIAQRRGTATAGFRRGDLGVVELQLGIVGRDLGHEHGG